MLRTLAAGVSLAALAGSASALTVQVSYHGPASTFGTWQLRYNGSNVGTATAGPLTHKFLSNNTVLYNQTLKTFCIDISQLVPPQNVALSYSIGSLADAPDANLPNGHVIGSNRAGLLASLYANAIDAGYLTSRGSATNAMDSKTAAVFQLAVWELAFETEGAHGNLGAGQFSLGGGSTAFDAGMTALFSTFMGWADAGDSLGGIRALTRNGAQDQIVVVPLPTGAGLALAGLTGIAIRRRR